MHAVEIKQGDLDKRLAYAHPKFVEPMLEYIISDFEKSRAAMDDPSIGGMVICDSSEQAKEMYRIFNAGNIKAVNINERPADYKIESVGEKRRLNYNELIKQANKVKSAALILHDVGC